MRAIFASGTPSFGSCAGLQVATVAAGGTVRPNVRGREVDFARRILKTSDGRDHPLLRGRPDVYDAPAVHVDEVETLPTGATHLASNRVTQVQAAEVRYDRGVFWGVQYHPELSLAEVAAALRRSRTDLINEGYVDTGKDLEAHASLIEELHEEPGRRDLAWRLGLDEQVTDERERVRELRNFIEHLALPTRSARGRG
jgi:GMP synthase (glutamine-hydrolysing)